MSITQFVCKKIITTVTVFLLLSIWIAPSHVIKAATSVEQNQSTQEKFRQRQSELNDIISRTKGNNSSRDEYTKALKEQLDITCAQIDTENQTLLKLKNEIGQKQTRINELQQEITDQLNLFKKEIKNAYAMGIDLSNDTAFLNLIFKAEKFKDFLNATDTVEVVNKHYNKILNTLESKSKELESENSELEGKKQASIQAKTALDNQKSNLEKLNRENQEELNKIRERKRQKYSSILSSTESRTSPSSYSGSRNGRYIYPLPGHNITSPFGERRGGGRRHLGVDIGASYGSHILAAGSGVVSHINTSGFGGGYGKYVEIDHGSGYSTFYAHCSVVNVSVGQQVSQGQAIACVGHTGISYGDHLHFETRINGNPYNPSTEI